MLTSHGWEIPSTAAVTYTIDQFENCGGIGVCDQCTREAENLTVENAAQIQSMHIHPEPAETVLIDPNNIEPAPTFVPIPVPVLDTPTDEE